MFSFKNQMQKLISFLFLILEEEYKIRTSSVIISPKDSKGEGHLHFTTVIYFPFFLLPTKGGHYFSFF